MILEAYIEFCNEYNKFTKKAAFDSLISFQKFKALFMAGGFEFDFSNMPLQPTIDRRKTFPLDKSPSLTLASPAATVSPSASSDNNSVAAAATLPQIPAFAAAYTEGSSSSFSSVSKKEVKEEEVEEVGIESTALDLEKEEKSEDDELPVPQSAPLPLKPLVLTKPPIRHTTSLPVSLHATPVRDEEKLRAKYKILLSIHKTIKNKILALYEGIANLDLAYTESEAQQIVDFFKDLTFTLKSLRAKDSLLHHEKHSDKMIHSFFVDLFNSAYLPRLEKIYRMALEKLSTKEQGAAKDQLMQLYNVLGLRYGSTGFSLFFSQTRHNAHFGDKGNAATARKTIRKVAEELRAHTLKSTDLPLSVYVGVQAESYSLFVKNNRTYAALSQAEVLPERVVPVLPTTEESKRPGELLKINELGLGEAIIEEPKCLDLDTAQNGYEEHKEEDEARITPRYSH
jgi:hypothetical protein